MTKKKTISAFDRISLRLTPKKREEMRKKALEERAKLSLAYQLGFYVGEEIVHRYLPTLSCDSIQTRTNISVTCGEGDECRRLNDVWFSKRMELEHKLNVEKKHKDWIDIEADVRKATEADWNALRAYHQMLEDKYLPKTIKCSFGLLNIQPEHMDDFKKGIGVSLWDCDCSHYSAKPEDIEVQADEEGWFTVITLKKD
jgi:hypothetical protein